MTLNNKLKTSFMGLAGLVVSLTTPMIIPTTKAFAEDIPAVCNNPDVGYEAAKARVMAQISESTRPWDYTTDEIEYFIAVQRSHTDEEIEEWKNSSFAGSGGYWDLYGAGELLQYRYEYSLTGISFEDYISRKGLPRFDRDLEGKKKEAMIPGRTSIGAYEVTIGWVDCSSYLSSPSGLKIVSDPY